MRWEQFENQLKCVEVALTVPDERGSADPVVVFDGVEEKTGDSYRLTPGTGLPCPTSAARRLVSQGGGAHECPFKIGVPRGVGCCLVPRHLVCRVSRGCLAKGVNGFLSHLQ